MEFLFNDLSIHKQFHDLPTFQAAITRLMKIRQILIQFGRDLYCHRNVLYSQVTPSLLMQQVIQRFDNNQRKAFMQWLTRSGPFWEDTQQSSPKELFECEGEDVSDCAVGESACRCLQGLLYHIISLSPSKWTFSPLTVTRIQDCGEQQVDVLNYWNEDEVNSALSQAPIPLMSWDQLSNESRNRYHNLVFLPKCFDFLQGIPFVPGAAKQISIRLNILNKFKDCFNENGQRTAEGQRLYVSHFTGENAWFSDSSDTEKNDFSLKLTFRHPEQQDETLFCPWHGKVNTPNLRIHFSWPVSVDSSLFVVYVGPKITKR